MKTNSILTPVRFMGFVPEISFQRTKNLHLIKLKKRKRQ